MNRNAVRHMNDKARRDHSLHHEKIALDSVNPRFEPILPPGADEDELPELADRIVIPGAEA